MQSVVCLLVLLAGTYTVADRHDPYNAAVNTFKQLQVNESDKLFFFHNCKLTISSYKFAETLHILAGYAQANIQMAMVVSPYTGRLKDFSDKVQQDLRAIGLDNYLFTWSFSLKNAVERKNQTSAYEHEAAFLPDKLPESRPSTLGLRMLMEYRPTIQQVAQDCDVPELQTVIDLLIDTVGPLHGITPESFQDTQALVEDNKEDSLNQFFAARAKTIENQWTAEAVALAMEAFSTALKDNFPKFFVRERDSLSTITSLVSGDGAFFKQWSTRLQGNCATSTLTKYINGLRFWRKREIKGEDAITPLSQVLTKAIEALLAPYEPQASDGAAVYKHIVNLTNGDVGGFLKTYKVIYLHDTVSDGLAGLKGLEHLSELSGGSFKDKPKFVTAVQVAMGSKHEKDLQQRSSFEHCPSSRFSAVYFTGV